MRGPVRDTAAMIAGMAPVLSDGRYVFAETRNPALLARAFAVVREAEGTTAVLPVEVAEGAGLDTSLPMACITLSVHSALDGVGLTAAVAQALAGAEIPCNVVAGVRHDHLFVPAAHGEAALARLRALSGAAATPPAPEGLTLRPAVPADDDAIWAVLAPAVAAGDVFAVAPEAGRAGAFAYFRPPGAELFVAERAGRVVGAYALKPNQGGGGDHTANAAYCTAPEARGAGVARAMLAHSLDTARARGFTAMQFNFVVATNTRAIETWARAGFAVVGRLPGAFRHPSEGLVDALVMHRQL